MALFGLFGKKKNEQEAREKERIEAEARVKAEAEAKAKAEAEAKAKAEEDARREEEKAQADIERGDRLIDEGKYDEAINLLKGYASKGNLEAGYLIADALTQKGDFKNALMFAKAVKSSCRPADKDMLADVNDLINEIETHKLFNDGVKKFQEYNVKGAIACWEKLVEKNHVQSMVNLATAYTFECDFDKAFEFIEKLSECEMTEKQEKQIESVKRFWRTFSEYMDTYNDGVDKYNKGNYNDAVKDLLKPAELGFRNARRLLGEIYASSKFEAKDETESFKWYKKAAEHGDISAQNETGMNYLMGRGTEKNTEEFVKWYGAAAKQGDWRAAQGLALRYLNGDKVERDIEKAYEWCQIALDNGCHLDPLTIRRVEEAKGYKDNEKLAQKEYEAGLKAEESGDMEAMHQHYMKVLELCGDGRYVQSETAYQVAYRVATMFIESMDTYDEEQKIQITETVKNIIDIADRHRGHATGLKEYFAYICAPNRKEAREHLSQILNNDTAEMELVEFAKEGMAIIDRIEECLDAAKKMVGIHSEKEYWSGSVYLDYLIEHFGELDQKEIEALEAVPLMHWEGKKLDFYETMADYYYFKAEHCRGAEANKWNEKAERAATEHDKLIDLANKWAKDWEETVQQVNQDKWEEGRKLFKDGNYAEAIKRFEVLALAGHMDATEVLAVMYYQGKGVSVNYGKAFSLFLQAAEQGSALAQYNVGYMYYEGEGTRTDKLEGKKWLKKAAAQGNKDAIAMLKNI